MPTTPTPNPTRAHPPAQQAASAIVEHVSLDALETVQRANPKNLARQAEYESKLRSLTAGGPAMVFHLGHDDVSAKSGKASSRGLKLRLTYAIKRMIRTDIVVQDAKLKDTGELIVAAYIKK